MDGNVSHKKHSGLMNSNKFSFVNEIKSWAPCSSPVLFLQVFALNAFLVLLDKFIR